jgi:hypothetical protein
MAAKEPLAELHAQFSSEGATATPWAEARQGLEKAEVFWLSTVRPGRTTTRHADGVRFDGWRRVLQHRPY